jgi:UDP-N-acetylmuramoyl-tripeptide--D-alanyl-D-alanine ligase
MYREFMLGEIAIMVDGRSNTNGRELVRGVSINSQTIKPGELFIALRGNRTDGHEYAADALRRGAIASVVDREMSIPGEIIVKDTLFALGELARNYRRGFSVKTIAVTGTNGKTTVKNLIATILESNSNVLCTDKNYNSLIGLPLTVLRLSGDETYLVLEMGTNRPGEIKRLCEIARPDIGVITNIGPGHLEGLDSIEGVRKEKLALIDALPTNGTALVGEGVDLSGRDNVVRFSSNMLEAVEVGESGSHFSHQGRAFFTPLLGAGNLYNCLAAVCLALQLGVDYETQRAALARMKPDPGRMEPLRVNGVLIIDDSYNANPVSMKTAIDFVAKSRRRRILVLGDMLELGMQSEDLHRDIGRYAQASADLLLACGTEAKHYGGKYFYDEGDLLRHLLKNITGDEIVLIKASRALHFERIVNALARLLR